MTRAVSEGREMKLLVMGGTECVCVRRIIDPIRTTIARYGRVRAVESAPRNPCAVIASSLAAVMSPPARRTAPHIAKG